MSTASNAELISTYESLILGTRATYATSAVVFFEHLITLKHEIDILWRRKWSAATWIFVFNRYFLLASALSQVVPAVPEVCNDSRVMNALTYFTFGEFASYSNHLFSILRTFALLQDHSWRLTVTWILVALTLATVILDSYVDFASIWVYVDDPILGSGCFVDGFSVPLGVVNRVNLATSVTSIILASLVLVITLLKTAHQVREASRLGLKTALSTVLLRDGSLFFLIILVNVVIVGLPRFNGMFLNGPAGNIMMPLIDILPKILLSRFIINLRQVDSPGINTSGNQHPSRFSIPNFRMPNLDDVVGNLGEPLDFAEDGLDDEDDGRNGGTDASENVEWKDTAGASWETCVVDVEVTSLAGNRGGSANTDAAVMDIQGIELENLRLSPVLSE